MRKGLLVVLVMATAFVFGGTAFAQNEADFPNIAKGNRIIREIEEGARARAEQDVGSRRVAADQFWQGATTHEKMPAPLPALPVPPIMTDRGMVQATNPRPLDNFPVARHQSAVNPQQVAKPIPAIKAPPVATEKGKVVETPNPRPTADFPLAKPQQKTPVAEIKRSKGFLDGKAVVVNQDNVTINVMLSASNNLGRKAAIHLPSGEYVLGTGTLQGWDFKPQRVKKVPPGYEIIEGKEIKS